MIDYPALAQQIVATGARKVLLVPPDHTRLHSRGGEIVAGLVGLLDGELEQVDVMPALGTHRPLGQAEADRLFGGAILAERLLVHDWRHAVTPIGELPAEEVDELVGRPLGLTLPFVLADRVADGTYDLVVAAGQVVPHEVAGYGGYTKHVCIGLGGRDTIQRSHFIGAVHGIEQTMGQADAPVRQLLDRGFERFVAPRCRVLFVLTVVELAGQETILRGVFAGEGRDTFLDAVALSEEVNIETVDEPFRRCVVQLDPLEYRSTWLGNKAIYRTRLAMADGGELFVLAPGVERFGEDPEVDALIRRHGYHGREAALAAMAEDPALAANLAAVAHLIHGSTEGRFEVVYCPGPGLSRADVEGAGFRYLPYEEAAATVARDPSVPQIADPGLGLWRAMRR
ncbi:MAG TPA: lactate racemase domain-containing protein [Gaiellaceae bacterium]|jgi:nickel-dependent lactate racemase|nr:lactate racemase domain-containing protein [Gaiellaceae bacterium]